MTILALVSLTTNLILLGLLVWQLVLIHQTHKHLDELMASLAKLDRDLAALQQNLDRMVLSVVRWVDDEGDAAPRRDMH